MSLLVTLIVAFLDAPLDSKCVSRHCQTSAKELIDNTDFINDPCDDFYTYACGNFANKHKVPSGEVLWDYFQMLQDAMDNVSTNILQSPVVEANPAAVVKAKHMYGACMDTESLDGFGLIPVMKFLEDWGGWPILDPEWQSSPPDWNYLADLIAEFAVQFLFSIQSLANLDNANTTALYIGSPNLGLPAPLLPLAKTPDLLREVRSATGSVESYPITQYLVTMAILLRDKLNTSVTDDVIEQDVMDIIHLMQNLSHEVSGSSAATTTVGELDAWMEEQLGNSTTTLKWVQFLEHALSKSGVHVMADIPVIISNPSALVHIINLVENSDPRVFRNYVISRLLVFLSPESSREMREAAFKFYVQQGYLPQDYPRWKYCLHKVMDYPYIGFSHAVAYQYRTTTFEPRKLKEAEQMVKDLISAFQELLSENEWMDDETRKKASEKMEAMFVVVGFPTWTDTAAQLDEFYNEMMVSHSDHFGNVARLRSFGQTMNLATLGKPRDRNNWTQSPLVVNAFYNGLNNRITFPVGMMSDPFFSGDIRQKALDYGRIGAIVGHEITHGFDSIGRLHDNFGSATNWWSNVTELRFDERTRCLVNQYNSFRVEEINATVNGLITLRENIADNGGVREAFRAFKRVQARYEPRLPGLELYTPDQLFFLGYATMWCRAETVQGLETMQGDSHSPNRFRVVGSLSNMKEFSDVFQCRLGSHMNPVTKCVLW